MEETERINLIEVGKRVREVREATIRNGKRLSQTALGKEIGYSQNNINKIEHGNTSKVNLDTIKAIATVCGCSEDYLLLRSDFKTRQEEIKAGIGQMQNHDIMIMSFIRYVAEFSGYTITEADRANVSPDDLIQSPYLLFEKDGQRKSLSLRETNDFINQVERHAALSLQMILDRKKRG